MKIRLNTKDLDHAIDVLKETKSIIKEKEKDLREMVAVLIQIKSQEGFDGAAYNDIVNEGFEGAQIIVHLNLEADKSVVYTNQLEAIFIEFGAGVSYNGPAGSSPHPSASKNAFYIGSYGYGYGKYEVWSFRGPNGEYVLTYGTPASMPMYKALEYVRRDLPEIAKSVFLGRNKHD